MVGMDIVEIGGEKVKTARANIRKLKSILDELCIMHIIDGVMFYSTSEKVDRMKEIHNVRGLKAEKNGGISLKNRFGHSGRLEYQELIIPDLFEINYTRLISIDEEEYKFVGNLLYGSEQ